MSVFADFQRMWMKRFPENSLSSEWEDDVRVSLQRHKQKVVDLSKELEQEMLYVEYLERLLSDVQEFRKAGGDPSVPIQSTDDDEQSSAAAAAATASEQLQSIDKPTQKDDDTASATNDEHALASQNGVCLYIYIWARLMWTLCTHEVFMAMQCVVTFTDCVCCYETCSIDRINCMLTLF